MSSEWLALGVSLRVSMAAAVVAAAAGVVLLYALMSGAGSPWRRVARAVLLGSRLLPAPVILVLAGVVWATPDSPFARAHQWFWGEALVLSEPLLLMGGILVAIPIIVRSGWKAVQDLEPAPYEAARTLGVSERRLFLPALRDTGWALPRASLRAFLMVLGQIGLAMLIASRLGEGVMGGEVLRAVKQQSTATWALILVCGVVVLLCAGGWLLSRQDESVGRTPGDSA
jgi:ABC-type molybdate transport system permease subunit